MRAPRRRTPTPSRAKARARVKCAAAKEIEAEYAKGRWTAVTSEMAVGAKEVRSEKRKIRPSNPKISSTLPPTRHTALAAATTGGSGDGRVLDDWVGPCGESMGGFMARIGARFSHENRCRGAGVVEILA